MANLTAKMLRDMMDQMPRREPDPFSLFPLYRPNIMGMDVVESPDVPRYVLPEEVIPGVPWPPVFRDDINRWSREFLGTTNAVPRGQAFVVANRYVMMRPSDVLKISNIGC